MHLQVKILFTSFWIALRKYCIVITVKFQINHINTSIFVCNQFHFLSALFPKFFFFSVQFYFLFYTMVRRCRFWVHLLNQNIFYNIQQSERLTTILFCGILKKKIFFNKIAFLGIFYIACGFDLVMSICIYQMLVESIAKMVPVYVFSEVFWLE